MTLIWNERTKLLANAIDRTSTACLTVGIAAPIAEFFYGTRHFLGWYWVGVCLAWCIIAARLHGLAGKPLALNKADA